MAAAVLSLASCGKKSGDGSPPINGNGLLGNQCPYGWITEPVPVALKLWNCPANFSSMDLSEPLQPLLIQGDCKKKLLAVRTPDHKIDTSWEIMPDGSFFVTVEGGYVKLKSDGAGNSDCTSPATIDLSGTLNCQDRDKLTIHLEAINWNLGKGKMPSGAKACQLPAGCYIGASADVKQCS